MGHVNNAVYADWLDAALRDAMLEMGWPIARLKEQGYQLRAEYLALDYKRAALPGERLSINTLIEGIEGRLCALSQSIRSDNGASQIEVAASASVYGWADSAGEPCAPPEGWKS